MNRCNIHRYHIPRYSYQADIHRYAFIYTKLRPNHICKAIDVIACVLMDVMTKIQWVQCLIQGCDAMCEVDMTS